MFNIKLNTHQTTKMGATMNIFKYLPYKLSKTSDPYENG